MTHSPPPLWTATNKTLFVFFDRNNPVGPPAKFVQNVNGWVVLSHVVTNVIYGKADESNILRPSLP